MVMVSSTLSLNEIRTQLEELVDRRLLAPLTAGEQRRWEILTVLEDQFLRSSF